MITILSPAKNVRFDVPEGRQRPVFLSETEKLVEVVRSFSPWQLEGLMQVNEKLAHEVFFFYQQYEVNQKGFMALYAYSGLVYRNIGAADFDAADLSFANRHIRILSGIYGIVKPCDGILPYRLEMGCRLAVAGKENLYDFWADRLYMHVSPMQPIVNLASEEYARAIRRYLTPHDTFIDIEFRTLYKGKYRVLPAWAKQARGQMARFIVKNRIDQPHQLVAFDWEGYTFQDKQSSERRYVFVRS